MEVCFSILSPSDYNHIFLVMELGNSVVMISRLDYLNKMKHLISERIKLNGLQHNPTKSTEESLSAYLRILRNDKIIDDAIFYKILTCQVGLLLAFYMAFPKFVKLAVLCALSFNPINTILLFTMCLTSANLDQPMYCQRLF